MTEKYKNDGTETILCPNCDKGFPHGAVANKIGQEYYHFNCAKKEKQSILRFLKYLDKKGFEFVSL